jgi:E3 ubiquitin-protein ligase UBR7
MGPLRQCVFACLTCNPPPVDSTAPYETPAGICYACSIQCHGEHTLVEIFNKRNFTCDCGTTRFSESSPCSLRLDPATNQKGVHSETPASKDGGNVYNQNFRNRFCSCECDYDPFQQKGTMFQCLGLGSHLTGGCGEDWYHPGCLVGLGPKWFERIHGDKGKEREPGTGGEDQDGEEDLPLPPGFPVEDSFEGFICFKCVEANPWIKRYAGSPGFLPAMFRGSSVAKASVADTAGASATTGTALHEAADDTMSRKRKADDLDEDESNPEKRTKTSEDSACKYDRLPPAPTGQFSLFYKAGFRDLLCRCASCYKDLEAHTQLLEEEEAYEPPLSDGAGSDDGAASTHGSGSLYERGESVLKNIDRVRAIEGVMAYNVMKEKLKPLFESFAGTGKAISADDIKDYFAKLRGDDEAMRNANKAAAENGGGTDNRREESGY